MTEKRYEYCRGKYKQYIQDVEKDGVWREGYRGTYDEFDLDKITVLLNRLNDENVKLKFDKQQLHRAMSREEVRHKQFRDKVFDLIDEKIKEADVYFKQSYDSWYQGKIDVLIELKKELQE